MADNNRIPLHSTKEEGEEWKLAKMKAHALRCCLKRRQFALGSSDRAALLASEFMNTAFDLPHETDRIRRLAGL